MNINTVLLKNIPFYIFSALTNWRGGGALSRKLQCGKALNAPPPHLDTIIVTTFSNNNKIIFNPNYIKGGGMWYATQKLATIVNPPPPNTPHF